MSLRFIPANDAPDHVSSNSLTAGNSALQLTQPPIPTGQTINGRHPLQARLAGWEDVQHENLMTQHRQIFGMAEPIKRTMELGIVDATDFVPMALGGPANVHKNILLNKEATIDWEDVYSGTFLPGFIVKTAILTFFLQDLIPM